MIKGINRMRPSMKFEVSDYLVPSNHVKYWSISILTTTYYENMIQDQGSIIQLEFHPQKEVASERVR
jgi:hypothetical protein